MRKPLVILFAILSAMMLLAIACSSDEANPDATATTAPPDTVAAGDRPTEPAATETPTAGPTATEDPTSDVVTLDIDVNGDDLQFDTDSLSASAGAEVVLNFNNSSGVHTHNWAVVEAGNKEAVAADGLAAGPDNNWLPVNDSRVIGATILIGPGESGQATFTAPSAGAYEFFCSFPGHGTMFGNFIVE